MSEQAADRAAPPEEGEPLLRGERVGLRPAVAEDAEALVAILAQPEVARWWGRYDLERVREELAGESRPGWFTTGGFAIVIDGAVAGWLQFHEELTPDYRHVSLDIGLAAELHGRGYGPEALRLAIRHFIERGHHRFTIDPAVENERAVRAYEAVGFRPVGVMRAYERAEDGSWRDGLLMDLLAGE